MKTTIWANCPKCQTELKIDTDEPELVQIECPDCNKVFAAKVPPRSALPVHDVFAQMPVLPAFQPAQVQYKARPKSNDSMSPAVLTALIVICASAILIPLGFGGYYVYSKLSESSQIALSDSAKSPPTANPSTASTDVVPSSGGFSSSPTIESVASNSASQPQMDSTTQTETKTFTVPELNPPALIQSDPNSPQVTQTPSSAPATSSPTTSSPTTSSPVPSGPMPSTSSPAVNSSSSQVQVSVAGAGTSKSGLPVALHRFVGSSGVFIFVLHSKGHSVGNAIQELQRSLSASEMHAEGGSDHTTIGLRYSGPVDSVVKGIQFGRVSYVDEESRSIHVQAN